MENNSDFSNLSRKERREKALDQIFGEDRKEYMGNIWGWKFSFISLFGLVLVSTLATYGVLTGKINLEKQMQKNSIESVSDIQSQQQQLLKDSTKLNK